MPPPPEDGALVNVGNGECHGLYRGTTGGYNGGLQRGFTTGGYNGAWVNVGKRGVSSSNEPPGSPLSLPVNSGEGAGGRRAVTQTHQGVSRRTREREGERREEEKDQ